MKGSEIASSESTLTPVIEFKSTLVLTKRQKLTLYTMCFVNFLKYMDRYTIAGILTPIQCEFDITDAQAGLLSTVFVASYMLCAPIFGYFGDRYSRKFQMIFGVVMWSASTLTASFMTNYWAFMTLRALTGVGEAMFSVVSPTIISDICTGDTRSNFLIIYYFAIPVGSGLGFVVGSGMAWIFGNWHWGLRLTPVLGILAVILLLIIEDPPRGESEGTHLSTTSWWADIKYLCTNKTFVQSTAGVTLVTYASGGLAWWGVTYITLGQTKYGMEQNVEVNLDIVALVFGVITILAGITGVWFGSFAGQKLRKRYPTADALVCAWGMVLAGPLTYWGVAIADGPLLPIYFIIFFAQFFMNINWAPSGDILLYVVVPTRRATAEAFVILISHALGDAFSPYIIGLVSDAFKQSLSNPYLLSDAIVNATAFKSYAADSPVFLEDSSSGNCTGSSSIDPATVDVDYTALEYSMMITCLFEAASALFFFISAWYLVEDKAKVDRAALEYNDARDKEDMNDKNTSVKVPTGLVIFVPNETN